MKILIGADLVPTQSNMKAFINAEIKSLVDDKLEALLHNADYRVFNLEVPLTDMENPIAKCGPNLIAPSESVNGIRALGADFLTLANNHILDQGEEGLNNTIYALVQSEIAYAGVGKTKEEASRPHIIEFDKTKIGFYCCVEHEFSIVSEKSSGANPFDPLWSLDHIQELKDNCDYVIVLYHGGKEQYRYPSPQLQETCRRIADKGADLVICQHTHCVGCKEEWNGSTIVYGQGNFLFDDCDNEFWQTSMLISIEGEKGQFSIEYIPLCKRGASVCMAPHDKREEIIRGFEKRSQEICEDNFVEDTYIKYAKEMLTSYYSRSLGRVQRNLLFRILNKMSGNELRNKCYTNADILALLNAIECEPHRELFIAGLKSNL